MMPLWHNYGKIRKTPLIYHYITKPGLVTRKQLNCGTVAAETHGDRCDA